MEVMGAKLDSSMPASPKCWWVEATVPGRSTARVRSLRTMEVKPSSAAAMAEKADAEVKGETGEEEAGELALAQVAGETGGSGAVVFGERGVAVDVLAEAFAEDELGMGDVEAGVKRGAGGALETVIGPEVLGCRRRLRRCR